MNKKILDWLANGETGVSSKTIKFDFFGSRIALSENAREGDYYRVDFATPSLRWSEKFYFQKKCDYWGIDEKDGPVIFVFKNFKDVLKYFKVIIDEQNEFITSRDLRSRFWENK